MLIDCDNFFVSCERIFQPLLKNRPVIVLSNNDGCVVSRSAEAKKIGIPMCAPYFKIKEILKANNGIALSSNYELYADISERMMAFLHNTFAEIEPYSIDEAFVKIPFKNNIFITASEIRKEILKQIGIPVSIGIAPTKTLCKIASHIAKQNQKIYQLDNTEDIQKILSQTEVSEIWGIGKHTAAKLNFMGIFTALELKNTPNKLIREGFGITLEKTAMELNGFPCMEIETPETQKSIISSGSFETEINSFEQLEQNLSEFIDCACKRLRKQNSLAGSITIEIASNRFSSTHPQYNNFQTINLPQPSNNTACFLTAMKDGLKKIYRRECWYKKAGVILSCLENETSGQLNWLNDDDKQKKEQKLMNAFDAINNRFGNRSIFFAIQNNKPKNYLKREFKSPSFTTNWNELLKVN